MSAKQPSWVDIVNKGNEEEKRRIENGKQKVNHKLNKPLVRKLNKPPKQTVTFICDGVETRTGWTELQRMLDDIHDSYY